ncbi:Adenylate kinase [Bertholletia excelsa]
MAGICRAATSSVARTSMRAAAAPAMRLLRQIFLRSYTTSAAAAQPQLDHDYYYRNLQDESESVSLWVQWAFIGQPGAKKHVYAEKLSKLLEVPHISMDSLVRQDLSPSSSLYKQIANAVNQGKLRLEDGQYEGETGFILDGIPRSRIQAEILDKLVEIDLVVNFKCAEDSLMKHRGDVQDVHGERELMPMLSRYSKNTSLLHLILRKRNECTVFLPIFLGGIFVQSRLVKQLEDYYKKQKKLVNFQVHSAPGETWQGLLSVLRLDHMYSAHSRLTSGSSLQ